MIPVKPSFSQIDELPGEEIEFSIGDARWVMRSMADLYSNREQAVTREYSTNARDANIEAGKSDVPIEVTLPSALNPYFVVRDFGEGMSASTLKEVYTKFGASTKRDSDDFNGMLGFGSKSAVAYTNTFTVTSIHKGIMNVAVITRKPDYSIVMKILATSKTTEPSGTEVSVPVHNWEEFSAKAKDFYKFWYPGTVLVNGREPDHYVGEKICDNLYLSPDSSSSYIVMGNVPYRIENARALFYDTKMRFVNFVAYVDNGDVEFTPSREDLKYTPHTRASLNKIINGFETHVLSESKKEIDACKTHAEAFKAWQKWSSLLGDALFAGLEFKGDKFDNDIELPPRTERYALVRTYGAATRRVSSWRVDAMSRTLVVKDYFLSVSSHTKRIIREYIELKGLDIDYVLFVPNAIIDSVWVDNSDFLTWDEIKAALPKKPKTSSRNVSGRVAGSWDYWDKNGYHTEQTLNDTDEVYWVTADESRNVLNRFTKMLNAIDSDAKVVKVYANRLKKFQRDFPKTQHFISYYKGFVEMDEEKTLNEDAKIYLSLNHQAIAFLKNLDVSKLKDPRFKKFKEIIRRGDSLLAERERNRELLRTGGLYFEKTYRNRLGSFDFVQKEYPLMFDRYSNVNTHPHVYLYMNAVYDTKGKE